MLRDMITPRAYSAFSSSILGVVVFAVASAGQGDAAAMSATNWAHAEPRSV
jgi:hypothetical protein